MKLHTLSLHTVNVDTACVLPGLWNFRGHGVAEACAKKERSGGWCGAGAPVAAAVAARSPAALLYAAGVVGLGARGRRRRAPRCTCRPGRDRQVNERFVVLALRCALFVADLPGDCPCLPAFFTRNARPHAVRWAVQFCRFQSSFCVLQLFPFVFFCCFWSPVASPWLGRAAAGSPRRPLRRDRLPWVAGVLERWGSFTPCVCLAAFGRGPSVAGSGASGSGGSWCLVRYCCLGPGGPPFVVGSFVGWCCFVRVLFIMVFWRCPARSVVIRAWDGWVANPFLEGRPSNFLFFSLARIKCLQRGWGAAAVRHHSNFGLLCPFCPPRCQLPMLGEDRNS